MTAYASVAEFRRQTLARALRFDPNDKEALSVWDTAEPPISLNEGRIAIAALAAINYVGVKPGSVLLNLLVLAKLAALAEGTGLSPEGTVPLLAALQRVAQGAVGDELRLAARGRAAAAAGGT